MALNELTKYYHLPKTKQTEKCLVKIHSHDIFLCSALLVIQIATAKKEEPKLIICGASAYSRDWDYERLRNIADEVGALLLADISHPSGLIARGLLNDPLEYCHIVTTTTHKTLRGPRGGLIMMRDVKVTPPRAPRRR